MAGIVTLIALALVGVAHLGALVVDRARAQNAADAAALSAAVADDATRVARRVAEHNGATIVTVDRRDLTAVVTVRIGRAEATAAAVPVPPRPVDAP